MQSLMSSTCIAIFKKAVRCLHYTIIKPKVLNRFRKTGKCSKRIVPKIIPQLSILRPKGKRKKKKQLKNSHRSHWGWGDTVHQTVASGRPQVAWLLEVGGWTTVRVPSRPTETVLGKWCPAGPEMLLDHMKKQATHMPMPGLYLTYNLYISGSVNALLHPSQGFKAVCQRCHSVPLPYSMLHSRS